MVKRLIYFIVILSFLGVRPSYAAIDPKEQMQIILFSGLGGAILGLSTLSFYGEPQNHLRNIAIGGAVALIGSVVFTTVIAAKESKAETEGDTGAAGIPSNKPSVDGVKKPSKASPKDSGDSKTKDGADDSYFDEDEEDSFNYQKDNQPYIGIFLADLGNNTFRINPSAIYLVPDSKTKHFNVYSRIVQFNF